MNFYLCKSTYSKRNIIFKMNKLVNIILIGIISNSLSAQVMWQFNKDTVITWNYQWGDEFDGNSLDEKKWGYWYGWARSIYPNKEQQYYTDGKNHQVSNGTLKLIARKEGVDARMVDWLPDTDTLKIDNKFYNFNKMHFNYTSGMVRSSREFVYGFYEIRFIAPKDKGMWPAFWIYGGDPNEEIDIMELKGEKPNKIHVDTHCANECDFFRTWYGKKLNWGGWANLTGSFQEGYNVVAAEWQPNYVKYYVNGKCVAISKVSFSVPKAIVANVAIPSNNGPFHPGPKKDFTMSEPFEIDYIRSWALPALKGRPANPETGDMITTSRKSNLKTSIVKPGRKDKHLFGKKREHANEGAMVSLFLSEKKKYIMYILGIEKGKDVKVELLGLSDTVLYSKSYNEFQNDLDFSQLPEGKYVISVSCGGKTVKTPIEF